jgi:hypothetical protein
MFSSQQRMDGHAELFSLQIPKRHVDGAHGSDGDRGAAEIHCPAQHELPESLGFKRVFPLQDLAQAAGDVVAEGRVHDGFNDFRGSICFADALQPVFGAHAHEDDVLATGGLGGYGGDAENLADDLPDFKGSVHG